MALLFTDIGDELGACKRAFNDMLLKYHEGLRGVLGGCHYHVPHRPIASFLSIFFPIALFVLRSFGMLHTFRVPGVSCIMCFSLPCMQYAKLRFEKPAGRLFDENPAIHVTATADAVIFYPTLGSILVGRVHVVGAGHIALLVAGVFNAIIFASDLAPWYSCVVPDASLASSALSPGGLCYAGTEAYDGAVSAAEGTASSKKSLLPSASLVALNPRELVEGADVVFRVKKITFAAGIMSLEGCFGPLA
jgi:hypothetical protein